MPASPPCATHYMPASPNRPRSYRRVATFCSGTPPSRESRRARSVRVDESTTAVIPINARFYHTHNCSKKKQKNSRARRRRSRRETKQHARTRGLLSVASGNDTCFMPYLALFLLSVPGGLFLLATTGFACLGRCVASYRGVSRSTMVSGNVQTRTPSVSTSVGVQTMQNTGNFQFFKWVSIAHVQVHRLTSSWNGALNCRGMGLDRSGEM